VRTSLPLIVAEEMEATGRGPVAQAPGDEVNTATRIRRLAQHAALSNSDAQIGASAARCWSRRRQTLGRAATEVKASNHEVVHSASGRRLGSGDLAADAAKESVPGVEGLS